MTTQLSNGTTKTPKFQLSLYPPGVPTLVAPALDPAVPYPSRPVAHLEAVRFEVRAWDQARGKMGLELVVAAEATTSWYLDVVMVGG